MKDSSIIIGLDVHKAKIVAAVLPPGREVVRETIEIENQPKPIEKLVKRLASNGDLHFVYEAGPCGYEVQRQISRLGHPCSVIAPSLTPVRPGDRVKTDRRDAKKLARLYRAGELTEIRVPTREEESARDLTRVREDALEDRLRARNRLSKFLLRQGRVHPESTAWGAAHRLWLRGQRFEWPALQQTFESYLRTLDEVEARLEVLDQQIVDLAQREPYRIPVQYLRSLKGIDTLSAFTMAVETQQFRRFEKAPSFMGFTGLVPSEYSSGDRVHRGGITKVGNAHLRRILVEAAWSYRFRNVASRALLQRRRECPPEVVRIAQKAQDRLHRKFWRMISRGKPNQVAVSAVARELSGFVWAIAQHFPS
jgi:transposase